MLPQGRRKRRIWSGCVASPSRCYGSGARSEPLRQKTHPRRCPQPAFPLNGIDLHPRQRAYHPAQDRSNQNERRLAPISGLPPALRRNAILPLADSWLANYGALRDLRLPFCRFSFCALLRPKSPLYHIMSRGNRRRRSLGRSYLHARLDSQIFGDCARWGSRCDEASDEVTFRPGRFAGRVP
jgi:hypothetical protein